MQKIPQNSNRSQRSESPEGSSRVISSQKLEKSGSPQSAPSQIEVDFTVPQYSPSSSSCSDSEIALKV